ncbi:MAG: cytochrome b N-terminal domain-containing protein, partial [Terracidiphilus sp.]
MSTEKNSAVKALVDLPKNVVRSVFRNPLPSSDRGRAATSFTNFFLHIQPVRVSKQALKPSYTMGLGLISLFLFVILTVTGVLLMFYYVPSTTQAYDRMLDLRSSVAFGVILRNMHRWAAHGMVAVVFLHMCRVFLTGAYKTPREFNWLIGVALFLLTLFASFTGYLLPWDQLAFWAITVGTSIAGYAPLIGKSLRFLLLGDSTVGQEALLRFYVLHVVVIPMMIALFVAVHFWRIRKDGGLAKPESEKGTAAPAAAAGATAASTPVPVTTVVTATAPARRFTIQGLVRGPFVKVGKLE